MDNICRVYLTRYKPTLQIGRIKKSPTIWRGGMRIENTIGQTELGLVEIKQEPELVYDLILADTPQMEQLIAEGLVIIDGIKYLLESEHYEFEGNAKVHYLYVLEDVKLDSVKEVTLTMEEARILAKDFEANEEKWKTREKIRDEADSKLFQKLKKENGKQVAGRHTIEKLEREKIAQEKRILVQAIAIIILALLIIPILLLI